MVTAGINRIHITPPYLFVTPRQIALLVVLPGDVADMLYAQKCIFMWFMCHIKNLTAIFATRSMVLLAVRLIPAAGFILFMALLSFCRKARPLRTPRYVYSLIPNRRIPGRFLYVCLCGFRLCRIPRLSPYPLPCSCGTPLWCRGQTPCAFPGYPSDLGSTKNVSSCTTSMQQASITTLHSARSRSARSLSFATSSTMRT